MKLLGLLVGVLALTAGSSPNWVTFRTDGISVRYPPRWFATARPLTPVTAPPQVLAVASYRFPKNPRANGCKPSGTLAKMPHSGALIFVIEYGYGRARVFPPRPKHFRLRGFGNYECLGPSYLLRFREAGRFFQIHITFGRDTGAATRATVLRILDSFNAMAR